MVEHCRANAAGHGFESVITVEVAKFFCVYLQLLKLQLPLRQSFLHLKFVLPQSTSSLSGKIENKRLHTIHVIIAQNAGMRDEP